MRLRNHLLVPVLSAVTAVAFLPPLALALAPARQQQPVVATKITLRHADASEVITLLKQAKRSGRGVPQDGADWKPEGVFAVSPIQKGGALSVKGTPDGVRMLQGLVSLLDVPQKRVQVKMRVVQVQFGPNGRKTETVLHKPIITTLHNKTGEVRVTDKSRRDTLLIRVTPRLSGDGQATLLTLLSVVWPRGTRDSLERPATVPLGATRRVIGVTDSDETPVMQAVGKGTVPASWSKACTAVYVEATPSEVDPAKEKAGGP